MVEMRGREQQAQEPGGLGCSVTYHVSAHAFIYTRVRVHPSLLGNLFDVYSLLSTVHYVPLPQAVMTRSMTMISGLSCQFPPSVGPRLAELIPTVTGGHWATPTARGCVGLGG